jgi:hypothetical protein
MLRRDGVGSSVVPPSESRSSLLAISDDDDGGADDVHTLVEQLDVASSTLREERQETDWLRLSVATAKRQTATAELAATEA